MQIEHASDRHRDRPNPSVLQPFSECDKRPVYLFDEGPGPEEIPVDAIPWTTPFSTTAKLWLASYAKWREAPRRANETQR
jgi:hypothetical protein